MCTCICVMSKRGGTCPNTLKYQHACWLQKFFTYNNITTSHTHILWNKKVQILSALPWLLDLWHKLWKKLKQNTIRVSGCFHQTWQMWSFFCRTGTAEKLPFPDGSVDLLAAASAAHWFDVPKFLAEANRVLKPGGCMALLGFGDNCPKFTYKDCGDKLNSIYQEVRSQPWMRL